MRCRGFSLLELLCTLLVASVAVALGGPALSSLALDGRRSADVNALIAAFQLARSESAKSGRPVVVCQTAGPRRCAGTGRQLEHGWTVFVNLSDETPPTIDPEDTVLLARSPVTTGTIRSNRRLYIFRPYFRRSTNGTITFCDRRGAAAARAIIVSHTGRPRVSATGPGGRTLECAG